MAPHGILSGDALQIINTSDNLDEVVITNTGNLDNRHIEVLTNHKSTKFHFYLSFN